MKVYVAVAWDWGCATNLGVFSTRKKAEDALNSYEKELSNDEKRNERRWGFVVEEHDIK